MAQTFVAATADRSHVVHIPLPLERAMRLFEPEGEKQWAKGWSPNYLAPSDGTALSEEGNAYVRAMDDNRFAATIALWESAIRAALAR